MADNKQPSPGAQAPAFTKQNLLTFRRYANRRDLLSVLLEEGQTYTTAQVDSLLAAFLTTHSKKGRVN